MLVFFAYLRLLFLGFEVGVARGIIEKLTEKKIGAGVGVIQR